MKYRNVCKIHEIQYLNYTLKNQKDLQIFSFRKFCKLQIGDYRSHSLKTLKESGQT